MGVYYFTCDIGWADIEALLAVFTSTGFHPASSVASTRRSRAMTCGCLGEVQATGVLLE